MADKSKHPGRPSLLTADVRDRIALAVRNGCTRDIAALSCGVDKSTFYRWMRLGRDACTLLETGAEIEESAVPYFELYHAVRTADAVMESDALAAIADAGASDWKAHAWRLERTRPGRYALVTNLRHSGADGGAVAIDINWT